MYHIQTMLSHGQRKIIVVHVLCRICHTDDKMLDIVGLSLLYMRWEYPQLMILTLAHYWGHNGLHKQFVPLINRETLLRVPSSQKRQGCLIFKFSLISWLKRSTSLVRLRPG